MKEKPINILVQEAQQGDLNALNKLLQQVQDKIYHLSLKMLLYPPDAADATQEILIKVMNSLNSFQGKSQFTSWVYRVASNHLLTTKGKLSRQFQMPFEAYAALIDQGQQIPVNYTQNKGELKLLEEEVKVSCTHGLLLCLNEKNRLIYILGDILEFKSEEASKILDITAGSFRKQLSRSRTKIRSFLQEKCGLMNPRNSCRCKKKIDFLINQNIIDPNELRFAPYTKRSIDLFDKIEQLEKVTALYRSTLHYPTPQKFAQQIKQIYES